MIFHKIKTLRYVMVRTKRLMKNENVANLT